MYESPIKIIESKIDSFSNAIIKQKDDAIFAEIQSSFGVELDRGELIRALQYDRDQYDKGYSNGKRDAMGELVRCKDCKHFIQEEHGCNHFGYYSHTPWVDEVDFCSYGERREDNGKSTSSE